MKTSWNKPDVCSGFEDYRDLPEQLLGYRFLFKELMPYLLRNEMILDYGCGPGKVAMRIAQLGAKSILAVDTSSTMLEISRARRSHSAIEYRLVEDGNLAFLGDNSIVAALVCFVFINIDSDARINSIIREIHRVLQVGSPLLIIDTNPLSTGIDFSTFRNGEAKGYRYGEDKTEVLHVPSGDDLILHDYYWPIEMYQRILRETGFTHIEQWEPTLRDIPRGELNAFSLLHGPIDWKGEWNHPPFILFRADK